jgi:uncharacterized coiled-coil DUF342 family protein
MHPSRRFIPEPKTLVINEAPEAAGVGSLRAGPAAGDAVAALRDELMEARRIASRATEELTGTSTQLDQLREIFEKTKRHLIQLQLNVTQLREERHKLANAAMENEMLRKKLQLVTGDRDRLQREVDSQRHWRG